jgi:hypothetical protein
MPDIQSGGVSVAGTAPTWLEQVARHAGLTLVAWSARRRARREQAAAMSAPAPGPKIGMLDAATPAAVRSFGFWPGSYR